MHIQVEASMRSAKLWSMLVACVLAAALASEPRPVAAQNLVAVVVGDLSPSAQWGKYTANVAMDMINVYGMLGDNMPQRQLHAVSVHLKRDADSAPQKLLQAIADLKVAREDA